MLLILEIGGLLHLLRLIGELVIVLCGLQELNLESLLVSRAVGLPLLVKLLRGLGVQAFKLDHLE